MESNKDLLEAIGSVTVRWGGLDLLLVDILYIAVGNADVATEIIFNSTNAGKQRLEKFDRVIGGSRLVQEDRQTLLDITGEFAAMLGTRNQIIHAPLISTFSTDDRKIRRSLQMLNRRGEVRQFRPETVERHIRELGELLDRLERVRDGLWERYIDQHDEGD